MTRLDAALAARGLARSRTHAATLITGGLVTVDGRQIIKSASAVADDAEIVVAETDQYVSRGAHKLVAALDAFNIPVDGRLALDMGASTGGFTQVLRERGARRVLAVDVGHGQLAASIAADAGVTGVEGFNVRYMTGENLAETTGESAAPELIVGDLS
ncbi:MAG: SAM-dependent methyltransferase, partial [Microbacteriaceae bacterium]